MVGGMGIAPIPTVYETIEVLLLQPPMVFRTRFELVISALKGQRLKPLV